MNKYKKTLIIFVLVIFLFSLFSPSVRSQEADRICLTDESAVCLDGQFVFSIGGSYRYKTKAEIIQKRIEAIAKDSSIPVNDILVKESNRDTTEVIAEDQDAEDQDLVLVEITDNDAKQEGFSSRKKLAKYYQVKIQENLREYRINQTFEEIVNVFIVVSLITVLCFLVLIPVTFICLFGASQTWKFYKQLWRWLCDLFGKGIEGVIFAIIVTLLARLIFIFFKLNFEFSFTEEALANLLTQIVQLSQIIGFILLGGFLSMLLRWFSSSRAGTVVLPFEETPELPNIKGKALADLLVAELHRIRDIHTRSIESVIEAGEDINRQKLDRFNFPPVTPIRENIENHLIDVGSLEAGKASFDFGRILLILRWLWPFGGVRRVISGSIHTYGSETRLLVRLERENQVNAWKVTYNRPTELITDKIRDLAFIVSKELIPKITAQTWEGFKFFTEAISCYHQYKQTGNIEYLLKTECNCQKAREAESQSERFYGKLSDLFYKIGLAYFELGEYCEAQIAFKSSSEVDPKNEYAYNGLGNVYCSENQFDEALSQYEHSKRLNKNFPYPYNGMANVFFQKGKYKDAEDSYKSACKKDQEYWDSNFWKPYHNLGSLHLYGGQELVNYKEAIENFEEAIKINQKIKNSRELYPPYSGMALAHFFEATKVLKQESKKDSLTKAMENIQKALDIALEPQPYLYWNSGLIKLAQAKFGKEAELAQEKVINEALKDWKKASELACQKNDLFYCALYKDVAKIVSKEEVSDENLKQLTQKIKNISEKKGSLAVLKKDIECIVKIISEIPDTTEGQRTQLKRIISELE